MSRKHNIKIFSVDKGKNVPPNAPNEQSATEESDYPIFCFRYLDRKYHIDGCQKDEKIAFLERLIKLSTLSWNQIHLSDRHGFGTEKIAWKAIKKQIPIGFSEDDNLFALRFQGLKPFLGCRRGTVFHILFIDRDFSLYEHH